MFVFVELKHLLLEVLPSPAMIAEARSLCIQNHLAMVSDSLWAINSMILVPELKALYKEGLSKNEMLVKEFEELNRALDVPTEFADWTIDVLVAVIDVGELLSRILDREASLHRSIVGNIQQMHFRHVILAELNKMLCNLNSLVLRGSAMGLRRDPMESMNPLQEDYSIVLKNEVVGREEDLEELTAIIQQRQLVPSNNNGNDSDPFVIVIYGEQGVGKTTLARMIYHHTWIRQQFYHRIWVDLPSISPFKIINIIGKEFARSINNEEYCDQKLHPELPLQAMWEYINEQQDGSRYLLVLHCENLNSLMQREWDELKNILLCVGGPGSAVLIILKSSTEELGSDMGFLNGVKDITTYCLNPLSEDASLELFKRHAAMTISPSKQDKSQNDELIPFYVKILGWLDHNIRPTLEGPLLDFLKHFYGLRDMPLYLVRERQYRHLLDVDAHIDYIIVMLDMLNVEGLLPVEGYAEGWIERYYNKFLEQDRKIWQISKFKFRRMTYLHTKVPKDSPTIPGSCRYLCLEINYRRKRR